MNVPSITPQQLHELVEAGADVELIDVRTPVEFREVHVGFAVARGRPEKKHSINSSDQPGPPAAA